MTVGWLDKVIQEARLRAVEQRERDALARAGEVIAASIEGDAGAAVEQQPAAVRHLRRRAAELTETIPRSFEADRADYASVSRNLRWLVVLRGLCTRALLRNQRERCQRDLRPFYEELGRSARTPSKSVAAKSRPSPVQPEALPLPAMSRVAVEASLLGRAVKRQLRDRLFPRLPALVGLAAGWWVANTYTDSHWKSALRSVGIGGGGTHVVSGEMYRVMMFGLPILSAAVCAYLSDRLAHFLRNRYAPEISPPESTRHAGEMPVAD